MECLHRFCESCINRALRTGKKECPSCRKKCPSHRHLRADTEFIGLIGELFPDRKMSEVEADASDASTHAQTRTFLRARLSASVRNAGKKPRSTKGTLLSNKSSSPQTERILQPKRVSKRQAEEAVKKLARGPNDTLGFVIRRNKTGKLRVYTKRRFYRVSHKAKVVTVKKLIANRLNQIKTIPRKISHEDLILSLGNRQWHEGGSYYEVPNLETNKLCEDKMELEELFLEWPLSTCLDFQYDVKHSLGRG